MPKSSTWIQMAASKTRKYLIRQQSLDFKFYQQSQMSIYKHQDEDDQIPNLIPLQRKKVQLKVTTPNQKSSIDHEAMTSTIKDLVRKTPTAKEKVQEKAPELPTEEKLKSITQSVRQKIPGIVKRDNAYKFDEEKGRKDNEKMKAVITQMLTGMAIKSSAEELYPVSNQTIRQLLDQIDIEISELMVDLQKKQGALIANHNNQHLKRDIEINKRQIDRCSNLKKLYHEKISYRSKIQLLQQTVGNLRNQNKSLKNQISRGIESIQSYNHNLPCDRQKQLENKLAKISQQLTSEMEMRINLEKSIDSIIMNFKRLYEQADAARLIVTQKLRDVEEREKKLKSMETEQEKSMIISVSKSHQEKDIPNFLSLNSRENTSSLRRQFQTDLKTTENKNKPNKYSTTRQKDQKSFSGISDQSSGLTMEQKIKRMKANQAKLGNVFKH